MADIKKSQQTDINPQSILNKSRLDKFLLVLQVPEALKSTAVETGRQTDQKSHLTVLPDKLQYSIYGAVVPAVSIPSIDVPKYGQSLKISSHNRPAYDDVTVNFTVDNQFSNYWYIWRWLEILNDSKYSEYDYWRVGTSKRPAPVESLYGETIVPPDDLGRPGPEYMIDYQTDFTIFGLNEYDARVVEFSYTNAFPVGLGEIGYNYRKSEEMESSITFSFSQLHVKLL